MPLPDQELVEYIKKAWQCHKQGKVKTCMLILLQMPKYDDRSAEAAADLMVDVLRKHAEHAEVVKAHEEVAEWYGRFPGVLEGIGAVMLHNENYREALTYYKGGVRENPWSAAGWAGVDAATAASFNRYHFRMLNDKERNASYKKAIYEMGGHLTIDIGAGTGLLSMYAAEAGCKVTAYEADPVMADIARLTLADTAVTLIEEHSTAVVLPADTKLVVTEIFDCAIYGEGVVETMKSVHSTLDGVRVIPQRAELYGWLIESAELCNQIFTAPRTIKGAVIPSVLGRCEMDEGDAEWEPYHAVNVNRLRVVPRALSQPLLLSSFCMQTANHETNTAHFNVQSPGEACAVLTSMTLHFNDAERYCSAMPGSCWDQAVFPLSSPSQLSLGQQVSVPFTVNETIEADVQRDSRIIATYDEVRRLNDSELWSTLVEVLPLAECAVVVSSGLCWYPALLSKAGVDVVMYGNEAWGTACCEANGPGVLQGADLRCRLMCGCVIQPNGLLDRSLEVMKQFRATGGMSFPREVHMQCFLVESEDLLQSNKVSDTNTQGVGVAEAINSYSSRMVPNVDMQTLPHKVLSLPSQKISVFDTEVHTVEVQVTRSGTCHAVPFFFTFCGVSTLEPKYHFRTAVELVDPISVEKGCVLKLAVLIDQSTVKITVA
eukprot:TRINITY_DN1917_c0_g2_i1.p1 TRINITY_DN1917_c0_g2~~TRINITY_DN1917_c0_g2_i1.p1  ORF type:complete len:659 (+),score=131.05 TRINITY_DN1917_c0_g2_i1:1024-3000(+)